jgi:hypothetical protein
MTAFALRHDLLDVETGDRRLCEEVVGVAGDEQPFLAAPVAQLVLDAWRTIA